MAHYRQLDDFGFYDLVNGKVEESPNNSACFYNQTFMLWVRNSELLNLQHWKPLNNVNFFKLLLKQSED